MSQFKSAAKRANIARRIRNKWLRHRERARVKKEAQIELDELTAIDESD